MLTFDAIGHLAPISATVSILAEIEAVRRACINFLSAMTPEQDPVITEISATFEQIRRANQMLAYHRQSKEIDQNAIQNIERLKTDFLRQLAELLKELEIDADLHAFV